MRKRSAAFLLALCLLLLCSGCGGGRRSLVVGFDSSFPPFGYVAEDGSYTGFDIDMARRVCEMEGWEPVLVPINWDEKDTELNAGRIDCIWNGFTMTGREADYTLSIPYCNNRHCVTVRTESGMSSLADLQGAVVGVAAASSISGYLLEDPDGQKLSDTFGLLAQFSDFAAAYEALEEGSLDAVIADAGITGYYAEHSEGRFRVFDEDLLEEQYGIAFKKGNTELCRIIDRDLKKLAEDGTAEQLAEKYGLSGQLCIP